MLCRVLICDEVGNCDPAPQNTAELHPQLIGNMRDSRKQAPPEPGTCNFLAFLIYLITGSQDRLEYVAINCHLCHTIIPEGKCLNEILSRVAWFY